VGKFTSGSARKEAVNIYRRNPLAQHYRANQSVLKQIAQEYSKYFDKLVDMFVRIGDVLPRFRGYEALFQSYEAFRQALSKAYLTIIEFCVDARSLFVNARKSPGTSFTISLSLPPTVLANRSELRTYSRLGYLHNHLETIYYALR
jgi:hypothetical protein